VNISAPFIRRPVATSLIAAALFVFGVVAYFNLPVAALPQVDFPTIQVSASLPGASPETMASNVATPLERQLSLIAGVTQMTSTSSNGSTNITLQFELSRNIDAAQQDVLAAINAAGGQLPTNLPSPPNLRKVNPADSPIMILGLTSDSLPVSTVSDYADSVLAQQISRIDGVGQVNVGGSQKPAIRIRLDPNKVAALGLQIDAVRAQIAASTVNLPKGVLNGPQQAATIYANDQIMDVAQWNNLVVGYHNGAPIRVSDLGGAVADVENNQVGGWVFPGKAGEDPQGRPSRGILLIVFKQPGANVIQTVDRIRATLPLLQADIPPAINIHILADRTQTIRASVQDVELTLLATVFLVVGVIFLFLRNWRATLIPSVVIPLSLLGTAAVMLAVRFSIDNLSLMAMSIAVGFVVDDAIVMEEVIWRRIEHGEKPFEAALGGSAEIGFTILSISISLIAVFTPLMFMGGVVGRLMREFALTLSAAVIISLLLSFSLTPMMAGKFLQPPKPAGNAFIKALERGFHWIETSYASALDVVLRHMRLTMAVFAATAALAVVLYVTVPTGFFPQQDTGNLFGQIITAQDSSFARTADKAQQVGEILSRDPAVTDVGMFVGSGGLNSASVFVSLKEKDQGRTASADEVINRLRPQLARVVGAMTVMQAAQDINIGGRASRAQYQYTLADASLDELNTWAPRLTQKLAELPDLRDVQSDQQSQASAVNLVIDRDAAGRFGISPADIDTAIYDQIGQHQVAQYFTQLNAYHVIVEAPPDLQVTPALFNRVFLLSPITGKTVPLSFFVKVNPNATSSLVISHQSQFPAATISFNLAPGAALGKATKEVEAAGASIGAPVTLTGSFQGTAAAFQQSLSSEPILIAAALLAVYIILGILYESYIHPLTILSTLPSAGLGALLALLAVGQNLNVIGIIAIILLIGIVKKNGIMIVDVALRLQREESLSARDAVAEASHRRLRPILMTTACAFLGGLPMVFALGTGSEFRQPLGYAIVGGLVVSQVLTLFTTPVIYIYLDRLRRRFEPDEARGAAPAAQPAE
jgi:HAE1 family hydrophobic/amphiphilic exporter-1